MAYHPDMHQRRSRQVRVRSLLLTQHNTTTQHNAQHRTARVRGSRRLWRVTSRTDYLLRRAAPGRVRVPGPGPGRAPFGWVCRTDRCIAQAQAQRPAQAPAHTRTEWWERGPGRERAPAPGRGGGAAAQVRAAVAVEGLSAADWAGYGRAVGSGHTDCGGQTEA